jgi:hypothetical protein
MILVIGGRGNMGRRYGNILEEEGVEFKVLDIENLHHGKRLMDEAEKILIATPTELHEQYIIRGLNRGISVLCEKPLTKNLGQLRGCLDHPNAKDCLKMVNNYHYAYEWAKEREKKVNDGRVHPKDRNDTIYNFVNTGKDGIGWDCIQLIYHAKARVRLGNTSTEWKASINGVTLKKKDVIMGYRQMIIDFLWNKIPRQDFDKLYKAHETADKITEYHERQTRSDRDTATTEKYAPAI